MGQPNHLQYSVQEVQVELEKSSLQSNFLKYQSSDKNLEEIEFESRNRTNLISELKEKFRTWAQDKQIIYFLKKYRHFLSCQFLEINSTITKRIGSFIS